MVSPPHYAHGDDINQFGRRERSDRPESHSSGGVSDLGQRRGTAGGLGSLVQVRDAWWGGSISTTMASSLPIP